MKDPVEVKQEGRRMASRGVVYVATGRRYIDEALLSANSVKKQMPDIPVALFTDVEALVDMPPYPLDTVIFMGKAHGSCRDKIAPLARSPYEKNIFLDTDTFVCRKIYDLFDILDRYDIALAHAPDRCQYHLPDIPDCFPELNSGVIVYRRNQPVCELLEQWEVTFNAMLEKDTSSYRDQHSLREALFRSSVRFLVLPPEYNFRTIGPNFAGRNADVKIVHGRHADIERVAARLNASAKARVSLQHPFRKWTHELITYESFPESLANIIFQSLPERLKSFLSGLRRRIRNQS